MKKNTDNLQSKEAKALREQFFKTTDEIREQCKDVDLEVLEQEIAEALSVARKEQAHGPFYSVEEILKSLHKNAGSKKSS